jgi:cysteine synthase A
MLIESKRTILDSIGNTSLIALRNILPVNGSRILLKMEGENPTGSMKDRVARAIIETAESDGRLRTGASVVDYSSGNTGISLAMVCAVKSHPLYIVSSDAFAKEQLAHMKYLGAKLQIVPSQNGQVTAQLYHDMIEASRIIARKTNSFWADQMKNRDQLVAYRELAHEIWEQSYGEIDGFVQCVGTAASLRGIGEALRLYRGKIEIAAVEPSESAVISGGVSGSHQIDGIGVGYIVPLWQDLLADRVEQVSTAEAVAMTSRLAREEGIFAGASTGCNVVAALRLAERLGPGSTVVTIMCDTGMRYLSKH